MSSLNLNWRKIFSIHSSFIKKKNLLYSTFKDEKLALESMTLSNFLFMNQFSLKKDNEIKFLFSWLKRALVPLSNQLPPHSIIKITGPSSIDLLLPVNLQDVTKKITGAKCQQFSNDNTTLLKIEKIQTQQAVVPINLSAEK
jgi:hypothetical protein